MGETHEGLQVALTGAHVRKWTSLSLRSKRLGLQVAFPVDYRYGWNMADPEHQEILTEIRRTMGIDITWWAPTCTPWSQASRGDAEKREADREAQEPTLEWLVSDIQDGQDRGEHAVVENPATSEIWWKSVLQGLLALGLRAYIGDHCPFGATNENGEPVQKRTKYVSTFGLRGAARHCRCKVPHGQLVGHFD